MAAESNGPGRPTKLTVERHQTIVQLLGAGNYMETAAAAAGVSPSTMREWMRRGEREPDVEPFATFARDALQAMARAEARDVTLIAKASQSDWRAAAWRLEHRHPDRWGMRRVEHATPEGQSLNVQIVATEDEVRRWAKGD